MKPMHVQYSGRLCVVATSLYGNRRLALILVDRQRDERVCVATVNFPGVENNLQEGEFLVLNDEDAVGVLDVLSAADIVHPIGTTLKTPSGRIAHVCIKGLSYEDGL